jgi:3-hydroxy-9,10-secoandrosta-1,3,5(10)-triene-9,17-dione monooxygenase reductase component
VQSAPDLQVRYREVIGHFATGVAVVTGSGPTGQGGMTANAVCSLSLDPLLLLVCFDNTARTLPIVRSSGRFAVNVLSREQRDIALVFASKTAEQAKFDGIDYELRDGVPVLTGALAWLICELREVVPAGDHTIGIGAVSHMGHDVEREPLVWYRGEYRTIQPSAPHLGLAPP